jgi:uncharacterized protein
MNTAVASGPSADRTALALRGFGPVGIIAVLVILFAGNVTFSGLPVAPVGATLALLWTWRSRTPCGEMGLARPASWLRTIVIGVALGGALKLVMKTIVMPLAGAPPVNEAFAFLSGNRELLPIAAWSMVVAGFSEEIVFRGLLFERARRLIGDGPVAAAVIVIATSAWFGLQHYAGQGLPGVQQATIVGLVFGGIFAGTRNLWLLIAAHTAFDLTALTLIYWRLEAAVARLLFV